MLDKNKYEEEREKDWQGSETEVSLFAVARAASVTESRQNGLRATPEDPLSS